MADILLYRADGVYNATLSRRVVVLLGRLLIITSYYDELSKKRNP